MNTTTDNNMVVELNIGELKKNYGQSVTIRVGS